MPKKTAPTGQTYRIDGKTFVWTTDEGAEITIPLRIKLKVIRKLADRDLNDISTMFDILESVAPGQDEKLDEQDANDFQAMFSAWNSEYQALSGASLGESAGSSD